MKTRLFSVQDSTQMLRVLAILQASPEECADYLVIHTTKTQKQSADFIHSIETLAAMHSWAAQTVIKDYKIGDFSEDYFNQREALAKEFQKKIHDAFGLHHFDALYACRNYQVGNDILLRLYGDTAQSTCFGDGFGNIDILDDNKWRRFDRLSAILPRVPVEDLHETRFDLRQLPLQIIDKSVVTALAHAFSRIAADHLHAVPGAGKGNALLIPLTPMTEAGMVKSLTEEINYFVRKITKNRSLWMNSANIENIFIKPHPRQCNNQAAILAATLKKTQEFSKLNITCLEDGLLQYAPIELIAPMLKIAHIECPAISASTLSLNGLYNIPFSPITIEDILQISTDWHHKYFISWVNLACALSALPTWDKRSFLNGFPPKFPRFEIKSHTRPALLQRLHEAKHFAEEHSYAAGARILEEAREAIEDTSTRTPRVHAKEETMRVTFVAYGPNQINGPNIWLQRILPSLARRGFTPQVIFLMNADEPCQVVANLQAQGISCTTVPQRKYVEQTIVDLLHILKQDPPQAFVPNLSVPAYYAAKWVKAAGIPTIGILHSDDTFHHELIETFVSGHNGFELSAVVCVSQFIASLARAKASPSISIVHSPYGITLPDFTCSPPSDTLKLLYAGRLIQRQKRIFDILAATKAMLKLTPGVHASFYGEDRESGKAIREIQRSAARVPMSYGGILNFDQILPTFAKHHAFMLLSDYEGMSIALLEAMACGLVPLCTRTESGATELIRHNENGLLLDDRGASFLLAVQRLKNEPGLWERLSCRARETIQNAYTLDICADKWASLLHSLLQQSVRTKEIQIPAVHEISLPPVKTGKNGMSREDKRIPQKHLEDPSAPPRDAAFLAPRLSPEFADLYLVRHGILDRLNQAIPLFHGTLLDVGCGQMPYRDHILAQNPNIKRYIGLDFATGKYAERMQPDLTWDGSAIPLPDGAVDCAMATEVLEHCPEPLPVLTEIRRVLTPGGFLFFTTPFLWPIHDAPHDHYRYTPYALQRLLTEAGFEDVRIEALGGWNASLAQMIGLWLRRAPMSGETRERLNRDLYPFFTELLRTDTLPEDFSKNPMITGLAGTARTAKPRAVIPKNADGPRVIVVTDQFPVLSQTFILDQMTGLIDRGVAVEHWSMQRMDEPVMHENVRAYGLLEATHYITLPADALRKDPRLWTERFLRDNNIAPLDDVVAVQVHFGPNFNKLAPLFTAYPDLFTLTSFHGYDGSATFQVKGADVYEQLFARSNLITTPSLFMKETLTRYGCPPDKIVVQHYGKDAREFAPVPREPGRQTVKLLSVARFVEKKGLEYALSAFAKAQVGCDTEYRLIGYGPLEQKLVALARSLGVADKVVFLGQLPGDQVRREMNDADIFVLTSVTAANGDTEGVPVSLIEAQLLGLPVVSSRHAGIPELVVHNETGFLAEERNVAEIAGYMRALMHNPGIREVFSRNARTRALGAFEAATLNDTLAELLLHHKTERARPAAVDATAAPTSIPNRVYCPICRGRFEQFMPFGKPARQNALCPACSSLERHRALWVFLERHTDFFASRNLRLLHFAPEACLESRFRERFKARYVTADLLDRRADVQADITDLRFPDASFDVVYCSHVLEHVPEDRKAMRELYRVLDKDGIAIVMVPLRGQVTDEDLSVTSPEERTRRYGQWDHVRYYGLDIVGRLEEAGFAVQAVETAKTFTPDEMALMRLSSDWLFLCRKRGGAKTGAGPRPAGREASAKAQALRAAADHWSTTQTQARTRWWLHPAILRHLNALVGGQPEDGPWAGLERRMRGLSDGRGFPRGVSVACGSASKELRLLKKGLVGTFDLFEISAERLAAGKASAARQGLADRATFHALDAFAQDLDDRYDLVYWNNALHHMLDAREALLWSRDRLRPGGWLVMDDYVGATRFQWPDAQLEIASRIRRALPERLLRDPARPQTSCPVAVTRPSLASMLATDPTEAADSDNILPSLQDIFPGAQTLFTGGVVYSLALKDIIANFDDATDAARLQELLAYDAALAADGQTLYACAFARKQGAPGAQG